MSTTFLAALENLPGTAKLTLPVNCEGAYKAHLQGICLDAEGNVFWSWTDALVKTDKTGRLLKKIPVASHHGDLCFHDGRVYVAVNLGKFNQPAGSADSWVYVYDAASLEEMARHAVPEVVHGAGGIAWHEGRFIVVGGLPEGVEENYLYEYDSSFVFKKRHVLASGHTDKGIQTVVYAQGAWWFGCYGRPAVLLKAGPDLRFTGRWEFDAAVGIEALDENHLLLGRNRMEKGVGWAGHLLLAKPDPDRGLVVRP